MIRLAVPTLVGLGWFDGMKRSTIARVAPAGETLEENFALTMSVEPATLVICSDRVAWVTGFVTEVSSTDCGDDQPATVSNPRSTTGGGSPAGGTMPGQLIVAELEGVEANLDVGLRLEVEAVEGALVVLNGLQVDLGVGRRQRPLVRGLDGGSPTSPSSR